MPINSKDETQGCKTLAPFTKCGSGKQQFLSFTGYDYVYNQYATGSLKVSVRTCESKCYADCKCLAYFYNGNTGVCYLSNEVRTLKKVVDAKKSVHIKIWVQSVVQNLVIGLLWVLGLRLIFNSKIICFDFTLDLIFVFVDKILLLGCQCEDVWWFSRGSSVTRISVRTLQQRGKCSWIRFQQVLLCGLNVINGGSIV